jgi:hypothetical protein
MENTPKNSPPEPLAKILQRRGVNITDENVLPVMAIFRTHGVRTKSDFRKLLRGLRAEDAVRAAIPPLVGGAASALGGPVIGAVAGAAALGAATSARQTKDWRDRFKSALTSFWVSLTGAHAAQPLLEAGAQALAGTLTSHDLAWIDGNDLDKIEKTLAAYRRSYAEQFASFGRKAIGSFVQPKTGVHAAIGILGNLGDAVMNHSSPVTGALAKEAVSFFSPEQSPERQPVQENAAPQVTPSRTADALDLARSRTKADPRRRPPLDELDLKLPTKRPPPSLGR